MSRIKVAEIAEATAGGVREHLRQILTYVDRERFDVSLLCSVRREQDFEPELERFCAQGIPVVRVPMTRAIRPWNDLRCYRRIYWDLRVGRYDVVHTHGSKGGILGRLAAHRVGGSYVIHTGHTFPLQWARGAKQLFYAGLERRSARWADRIIALSDAQKQQLLSARISPEEKITVLPNAAEVPAPCGSAPRDEARRKLGLPPDAPCAGMAGRIVHQKDPLLFVRAAAVIAERRPDARLVWIGDGPLRRKMEAAANNAGILGKNLIVAGHRQDVRELYAAFDVFLMTTRWEGMPYAVLDAMAAGLPVVAVNVPGMNEIVDDGVTGWLTGPDEQALAGEVLGLFDNADRRRAYGEAAMVRVRERHSVSNFIARLEEFYATDSQRVERKQTPQTTEPA